MQLVEEEHEWFGPFHSIFSGCASYDTSLAECDFEPEENFTLLDDDEDDTELLDSFIGVYDAQCVLVETGCIDTNNSGPLVVNVTSKEITGASKASSRLAKYGPVEKEGTVKLSAKTLAFAQVNQKLKTSMQTLLVQKKVDAFASIQQEKTKAKMEMLATSLASQAARRQKAQEALERQESLKRTVEMRDRYMEIGLSPLSATAKAKLAEKELLDM